MYCTTYCYHKFTLIESRKIMIVVIRMFSCPIMITMAVAHAPRGSVEAIRSSDRFSEMDS